MPTKTAGRPVSYLVKHGFAGDIYPVNPKVDRIGELTCYPDVASLPAVPDVGIVLLGAERAHLAVRDLAARGTAAAIVLASGYTETGEEGARRQKQLIEAAGSMRILGPNTIGLVNLTDNIVLSATGALEMDHFPVGVDRRRLAKRRHPRRAAVARRGARHRPVEADLDQQRGRPRAGRLHRPPRRRRGDQGHRALHRDGAQPGEVPRRGAEGRARRQAGRRVQDRPLGGRRQGRGVAHRRAGRCRPHVRRAVQAGRRDPRADLRRPARHSGRARPPAASCAATASRSSRPPAVPARSCPTASAWPASTRRRPMPQRPRRCARCRPATTPCSTAIRST